MPHEWVSEASSLRIRTGITCGRIHITYTIISRILGVLADMQCTHYPFPLRPHYIDQAFRNICRACIQTEGRAFLPFSLISPQVLMLTGYFFRVMVPTATTVSAAVE
jgi:hypothetical protein